MKFLQTQNNASNHKSNSVLAELSKYSFSLRVGLDETKNIASLSPLHGKVIIVFVSEGVVRFCNKIGVPFCHDLLLQYETVG